MKKMRVVQVTHPGGPFELVEREIPMFEPNRSEKILRVLRPRDLKREK